MGITMSKRKPLISIQNIVASVSLNQKIDLQKIVEKFPLTEYNPSVFPSSAQAKWCAQVPNLKRNPAPPWKK